MESHLTLKTVSDLTLASSMTLRLFPEIRKVDHIINWVKSETIMIMSTLCLTNTLNWILLCRLTETTVYRLDMSLYPDILSRLRAKLSLLILLNAVWHRGRDCMVIGFTTLYAISAYQHWCCGFDSRSGQGVQHYVIKSVSDLGQVGGFLRFPPPIKP